MDRPLVSFVTVNWRAVDAIADLLDSLQRNVTFPHEITVANNDPTEAAQLQKLGVRHPEVRCVELGQNVGFAAACNAAARDARGKWLVFVNPDVQIKQFPARVLTEVEGRFGARLAFGTILAGPHGPQRGSVRRLPTYRRVLVEALGLDRLIPGLAGAGLFYRDETAIPPFSRVEQPIGAFFGIERELFFELGGFDERFFVYFEEADLALRASRLGIPIVLLPDLEVGHAGGHSTRGDHTRAIGLRWRSLRAFHAKHADHLRLPPAGLIIAVEAGRFKLQRLLPHITHPSYSLRRALRIARGSDTASTFAET